MFRSAALAAIEDDHRQGEPLLIVSTWTRLAIRVVVLGVVVGLGFAALVPVAQYAEGVAVVLDSAPAVVCASTWGIVRAVEVPAGRRVARGQILLRLDDVDASARAGAQVKRGPARRVVVAPRAANIADVHVGVGDSIAPGTPLVTFSEFDARPRVELRFAGELRPRLDVGTPMFVEFEGFAASRTPVVIESIADRLVPLAVGDGPEAPLGVPPSIVIAEGLLPGRCFGGDGERYELYEGMRGRADVRLRSVTLLELLLP